VDGLAYQEERQTKKWPTPTAQERYEESISEKGKEPQGTVTCNFFTCNFFKNNL